MTRLRPIQVRRLLGMTRRQLNYWHNSGLIEEPAGVEGIQQRRYGPRDLIVLKALQILRNQGLPVQQCGEPIEKLRKIMPSIPDHDLMGCCIIIGPAGPTILNTGQKIFSWVGGDRMIAVWQFAREIEEFVTDGKKERGDRFATEKRQLRRPPPAPLFSF